MGIEVNFRASDNCLTEQDVIEAARAAFAEVMSTSVPDDEYMREACTDLARGEKAVMWQSCGGFAEAVVQSVERRLFTLVRQRRGEAGFSPYVQGATVQDV